jgi:hypothetical protein
MKNGIATHPHHVCYVLRIDGRLNSKHRCFVDALRAALQLKDRFPRNNIKVGVAKTKNSIEDVLTRFGPVNFRRRSFAG